MNLNSVVRGKQRRLFGLILAAAAVIIGGLYLANRGAAGQTGSHESKPERTAAEPDLTGGGVVNRACCCVAGAGVPMATAQPASVRRLMTLLVALRLNTDCLK